MNNRKLKGYVLPTLYLSFAFVFMLITILINRSLKVSEEIADGLYTYVSYEILQDNSFPVVKEDNETIIKPFIEDKIEVKRGYYNSKTYKEEDNSIVFFENTYMQNKGIDYATDGSFNVVSILDGTVLDVLNDDIYGTTVIIRHNDDLESIYQSMGEVSVSKDDKVSKGQIIGKSGCNKVDSDLNEHLHFELVYKNNNVNPEDYYDKTIGEF